MKKIIKNQSFINNPVSIPNAMDLRGRQSVRATFRLSEACIDAISILAAQLGIKQKSVFDHLMEDDRALLDVARELKYAEIDRQEGIPKTFVISRRSLSFLETTAAEFNVPKDALVEHSIRRLLPVIAKERIKHEKRKELFMEFADNMAEGDKILSKAEDKVGENDMIVRKLGAAMAAYRNALEDVRRFIERGKSIENFQSK